MERLIVSLAILLAASGPTLGADRVLQVRGWASYSLHHPLKTVTARTEEVSGTLVVTGGGAELAVRAPVSSFDSGNRNRDAHMLEVVDARRYPDVVVRAHLDRLPWTDGEDRQLELPVEAQLHGVPVRCLVTLWLSRGADGRRRARFQLETRLSAHQIDRPSLLFMPVDDRLRVTGELVAPDETSESDLAHAKTPAGSGR
jgi:hypothetical protein